MLCCYTRIIDIKIIIITDMTTTDEVVPHPSQAKLIGGLKNNLKHIAESSPVRPSCICTRLLTAKHGGRACHMLNAALATLTT